jgi:hypothetical protein
MDEAPGFEWDGLSPNRSARPLQFGLAQLLGGVTAVAVVLGLLKLLGAFGALVAFLAAMAATLILYPRWRPAAIRQQEDLFDFVWGLLMPLVCLVMDPILLKHGDVNLPPRAGRPWDLADLFAKAEFYDYSLMAYAFIGWQLAYLLVAMTVGGRSPAFSGFISGTLRVGYLAAMFLGWMLLLPSLLGLYVGLGLLGFTPFFTAHAIRRRMLLADAANDWLIAGIVLAVGVPLGLGVIASSIGNVF